MSKSDHIADRSLPQSQQTSPPQHQSVNVRPVSPIDDVHSVEFIPEPEGELIEHPLEPHFEGAQIIRDVIVG